jgi:hypothetical protein
MHTALIPLETAVKVVDQQGNVSRLTGQSKVDDAGIVFVDVRVLGEVEEEILDMGGMEELALFSLACPLLGSDILQTPSAHVSLIVRHDNNVGVSLVQLFHVLDSVALGGEDLCPDGVGDGVGEDGRGYEEGVAAVGGDQRADGLDEIEVCVQSKHVHVLRQAGLPHAQLPVQTDCVEDVFVGVVGPPFNVGDKVWVGQVGVVEDGRLEREATPDLDESIVS